MEKFESGPQMEQPEEKKGTEVSEVKFEDLKKGDRLIIDTSDNPEKYMKQYEIVIVDMTRMKDGELKDLVVEFEEDGEIIVAKMSGDFTRFKEKDNVTKGTITNIENHCLYFENLNYRDRFEETKSGKKMVRCARSIRTTPIRKIILKSILID